jgi:hypothetical protein
MVKVAFDISMSPSRLQARIEGRRQRRVDAHRTDARLHHCVAHLAQ